MASQASLMPYGGRGERFLVMSEKSPFEREKPQTAPVWGGVLGVAEGWPMDLIVIRSTPIFAKGLCLINAPTQAIHS